MRPFASFYIGNIQSSLNTSFNAALPQTISFAKFRNNRILDESLAAGQFHIHPHLEIFYFESGEGFFETSAVKEKLAPHDLLIVNANNPHRQFSDNQPPLVYYCLSITNLELEGLPPNSVSKNVYELFRHTSSNNLPYKVIKGILRELGNLNNSGGFFKIQSLIYDLLSYIFKTLTPTAKQTSEKIKRTEKDIILQEVQKYLIEHFAEQITLADLEKNFFISKSLLCHYFKNKFRHFPNRISYPHPHRTRKNTFIQNKFDRFRHRRRSRFWKQQLFFLPLQKICGKIPFGISDIFKKCRSQNKTLTKNCCQCLVFLCFSPFLRSRLLIL